MHPLIAHHEEAIRALCRAYGVQRLDLFGSAATAAFDEARSDFDFLVAYPEGYDVGPWLSRLQELEEDLAHLLGREVNVVMSTALRNPWFRREAEQTRVALYGASERSEVA